MCIITPKKIDKEYNSYFLIFYFYNLGYSLPWVPEVILAQIETFVPNKLRRVRPKADRE